jgi:hypothetical protein
MRAVLSGPAACARATPKDTAVAATTSETASASVAINSTPTVRFLDNELSEMGDAKPTFPVSAVMAFHPSRISVSGCLNIAQDLGEAVDE